MVSALWWNLRMTNLDHLTLYLVSSLPFSSVNITSMFFNFPIHIFVEGKAKEHSKSTLRTGNDTVTVPSGNFSAVLSESKEMESEGKAGDMVTVASGNIGAGMTENNSTVTQEQPDNMVVEATGNFEGVIADSRKNEAEEKTDDMVIETTGRIGAVELDRRKAEPEDKATKQLRNSGTVTFGAQDKAEKLPANPDSDGKQTESKEKTATLQSSLDGIKSGSEEKSGQQLSSSKSTPLSNKSAKKRITPIAIDP